MQDIFNSKWMQEMASEAAQQSQAGTAGKYSQTITKYLTNVAQMAEGAAQEQRPTKLTLVPTNVSPPQSSLLTQNAPTCGAQEERAKIQGNPAYQYHKQNFVAKKQPLSKKKPIFKLQNAHATESINEGADQIYRKIDLTGKGKEPLLVHALKSPPDAKPELKYYQQNFVNRTDQGTNGSHSSGVHSHAPGQPPQISVYEMYKGNYRLNRRNRDPADSEGQ